MNFTQFLAYFIAADAILSVMIFTVLYICRRRLKNNLTMYFYSIYPFGKEWMQEEIEEEEEEEEEEEFSSQLNLM